MSGGDHTVLLKKSFDLAEFSLFQTFIKAKLRNTNNQQKKSKHTLKGHCFTIVCTWMCIYINIYAMFF